MRRTSKLLGSWLGTGLRRGGLQEPTFYYARSRPGARTRQDKLTRTKRGRLGRQVAQELMEVLHKGCCSLEVEGVDSFRAGLCRCSHSQLCKMMGGMPTNLAIDDALIQEAVELGGHKSKKDAVNSALAEYVQRRKQLEILQYIGKVDYDDDYDYKKARTKR